MDTSAWISLLAVFVAMLSALYARYAVSEARRMNEMSLHNERLKVYKAYLDMRGKVTTWGANIKESELFTEFYEYVELSEFYFDTELHKLLKAYFECLWDVIKMRDLIEVAGEERSEERKQRVEKTHAALNSCKAQTQALEDAFKKRLRLVKT